MAAETAPQTPPDWAGVDNLQGPLGDSRRTALCSSITLRYADRFGLDTTIVRREAADKHTQILHLNKQIETLEQAADAMSLFLSDLERVRGETFRTDANCSADDLLSALDYAFLDKKGVPLLVRTPMDASRRYVARFYERNNWARFDEN
jgi:hypothetical protein